MIPVCAPLLGDKELAYMTDCMKTNWISSKGKYIDKFERGFAEYCNCKYGVTTTNGTAAIHLALASIGLEKGDEVIVPAFTMMGSVFPIIYCGARPVFVDAEHETLNMDVNQIEEKITDKTRAIIPVHIYGHPCDMDKIMKLANDYGLFVVEDAAEAHGAEYFGKRIGGIGHVGCFSFYANKIITCGEGGMMITNDEKVAEKARLLKDLAFPKGDRRYLHSELGYNYRMTNIQAAIGLAQLERINEFVEMRRRNAKLYNQFLADIDGIKLPPEKDWAKNVYWMYSILIEPEFGVNRDQLITMLRDKQVETRPFFIPMDKQPVLHNLGLVTGDSYPVAADLSEKGMYLPSGSGLTSEEIRYVCDAIKEIAKHRNEINTKQ